MARSDPELDAAKRSIRRDIDGQSDAADYAMGIKTPEGKAFRTSNTTTNTTNRNKSDQGKLDIDDYLKQAEKGFIDVTPEDKDVPFNGNLKNVRIKRISKGDGKY